MTMPEIPDDLKVAQQDEDGPPLKVAICLPTHDMVPAGFMYDLANMAAFSGMTLIADDVADMSLMMMQGTIIQASREKLAQDALIADCTHLLWLDTDMRFPKDTLIRLLNRNKPIVGINYSKRKAPPDYTAFSSIDYNPETGRWGTKLPTRPDDYGLQEAAAIGFGVTLIQSRVFWDIADEEAGPGKPFFDFTHIGKGADWKGEDVYFCEKAKAAGYTTYVDADLSKRCAHVGQFEYRLDHVHAVEEAQAMDPHRTNVMVHGPEALEELNGS